MKSITYEWLAGWWDGECTIGIIRENRSKNKSGARYVAYMSVSNTHLPIMLELAKFFDKSLQTEKGFGPKAKTQYRLQLRGGSIDKHLPLMLPHLRVKRQQAEEVLRFREVRSKQTPGKRMDPQIDEESRRLWEELRTLNMRGVREHSCQ